MTRQEIYNNLWAIAQDEISSKGFRFSIEADTQMRSFIHHGVFNVMTVSEINDGSKIAEAEYNIREICQELCRRERQRQQRQMIVEARTFTETRFQFCPRYPFC